MKAFLLAFALTLAPARDLDEAKQWLQDSNDDLRRRAVTTLAEIGSPEAWELLVGALTDPEPRVADEAQLQLGKLADADVLADVVLKRDGLKHRDELVRSRVAEALGRMSLPLSARDVARGLFDKDAGVRRALLWSIERAAEHERIEGSTKPLVTALRKLAGKDRDLGVRAAAMVALARVEPDDVIRYCTDALDDDEPALRCAGIAAMEILGESQALGSLLELEARSGSPSARRQAIRGLERAGTRGAVELLVIVLEDEDAGLRVRWDAVGALRALSGRLHRLDPKPWRDWLESLPADWTGEARSERVGAEDGSISFAGLPVLSDRLVFLIDLSGSMNEGRDGTTRKDVAVAELEKTLSALPATARFDVIPYYDQPLPWQEELVEASPANVARALKYLDGTKQSGKGNLWDALELAFADPEVDTAIVFSDGVPSGGPHWNYELMHALLVEKNRFRNLTIDAVLVEPSGITRKFWEGLCADTGGRYVRAEIGGK